MVLLSACKTTNLQTEKSLTFIPEISYEKADERAGVLLETLTLDEKITLIGGYSRFFIHGIPEKNIPFLFMTDATQGVRLVSHLEDSTIVERLDRSTAFPCPILLSSTWEPELARKYARSVGEECRAAGVSYLLGPGLNAYRISQCGRNFEYFGEDPFLISRMIEKYVLGVQSTGVSATLKHFIANNTDFYRRRSNSIVDERALHEIYMPGFKAGIDAGAMAVMTSYNKLNGEWCGQSEYVISNLLRGQLGFRWLVMTDWTSVYDGEKVIKSGQNIEMPFLKAMGNVKELLDSGKVTEEHIDLMVRSILRTSIAMGFYDRVQQDTSYLSTFPEHEQIALDVARNGIVLLKNENDILPVSGDTDKKLVLTGKYLHETAHGGGSATVQGYNNITLAEALLAEYGEKITVVDNNGEENIKNADIVFLSIGTFDTEGGDRPFDLPSEELETIQKVLSLNSNVIIIVNSGSGINMSPFVEKAAAIIYAWYGGQTGNVALAEILTGKTNPSGKLPITIEKRFEDSPGYGYIPDNEEIYIGGSREDKFTHKEYDIHYNEGIFTGYRWYEHKNIEPLFPFGYGLSYTSFEYSDLQMTVGEFISGDELEVRFTVKNTGEVAGAEVAQLYIKDIESSHPRPLKELKGFAKVQLNAGETKEVSIVLDTEDFSYWNPDTKDWFAEPGAFKILIGSSSASILLEEDVTLLE
ncbi:MAG: glycoside hydrolase family 3 C-terminal domain-containing protein [Bacteroidales bacterium]|nr:glycoside hydrolase family 3 C-terminal domain-containing protein [Bacteroidales bacterium]